MKRAHTLVFSALCLISVGGFVVLSAVPTAGKNIRQVSEILNTTEPYSVIAAIPDVSAFTAKLRQGDAMRSFFDSPLGLHFLRSAPLRGAAHLHRLISLAPRSWQWNLYSLLSDGPVFYRSSGKKFSLVIALNNKGKLITSIISDAHAVKEGDWLIIASDKETLKEQLAYLQKPMLREFAGDMYLRDSTALMVAVGSAGEGGKKKSLLRTLIAQAAASPSLNGCIFKVKPAGETLGLEGECPATAESAPASTTSEKITLGNFPGYVYFRKPASRAAHVIALGGFTLDYGYLVPQLFYSGPSTDQKSIEFLSQAFKTKNHKLEAKGEAIQIRFPAAYSYRDRKFDLFSPHLIANRERFYWHSYLGDEKNGTMQLELNPAYNFYASVQFFSLYKKCEGALKQFDALYSPGHFNEFRDALAKSAPSLKNASLRIFTKSDGKKIRVGGAFNFAET